MPLYELYRRANVSQDSNPTGSSGQSPVPENDLFELVCENGQIVMQGHSNAPKRTEACKSLPSQCLPSYSPRVRDVLIGNSRDARFGKLRELDSAIDEIPMLVPSSEKDLNQDADMVPWWNYATEYPLQYDCSSDLLAELSAVTAYEHPNRDNSSVVDKKRSYNHAYRNCHKYSVHGGASSEQGNVSKVSSNGEGGTAIVDTSPNRSYQSLSEHQTSFTFPRSREFNSQNKISNGLRNLYSYDVTPVPSTSVSTDFKMLKKDSVLLSNSSTMMNFSLFARPAALVRVNLQSNGVMCKLPSARIDNVAKEERKFTSSSSNAPKSMPTGSSNCYAKQSTEQGKQGMLPSKVDRPPLHSKPYQEHTTAAAKSSETPCKTDDPKDEEASCQIPIEDTAKGWTDGEKSVEPVVASSICSGNRVEKASNEPIPNKRRKTLDTEESKCHSEKAYTNERDIEQESVGVTRAPLARGGAGYKRNRAAEVHNLSERRRRDRINEKMRALQALIPNCNKVDKASMLDDAIQYLKTLQLQVQMMSMGAGLYIPPMMLPTAMQHLYAPLMPSFSPMDVGMHVGFGRGYGMGMTDINGTPSYPMMPIPTVQGSQFPTPPTSGQIGLKGMAESPLQMFGLPGHGLPF